MRLASTLVLSLLAISLGSCATTDPASSAAADGVPAIVTRDGDVWTLDYQFDRDVPVWAFHRSSLVMDSRQPWRPRDWTVTTPGVVLERVGHLDVLRNVDGGPVPRRVSLSLRPVNHALEADYPVLVFTDGSVALPTGQFDVFPLESLEAARAAPEDLNGFDMQDVDLRLSLSDRAGPILHQGQRYDGVTTDAAAYVLFGQAEMRETPELVTVVDPQLPEWVTATIEDFAPRAAAYYAARLGPGETARPTIFAAWNGPTAGVSSLSGSVLPGQIVISFEGEGLVERSPEILAMARWFIGHESAHFWLGQTVRYERARDAWITEGGADLMAIRALKAADAAYDDRGELQKAVDDCVDLADEPVNAAGSRGEHRAFYACGAVFALVAEAAQARATGGDWFDFLAPLIAANREDGVLARDEWLAALTDLFGDPTLAADIEHLLDQGSDDPQAAIAALFTRAGVEHRMEAGRLVLGPQA